MKRILIFASIALMALVFSCKKDPTPQELIIGRWKASKAFIGATDVLVPTSTTENELEIEFIESKSVLFHRKNTTLTTNPPTVFESTLNGTYSWNGDIITIIVTAGNDTRTVTGPVEITARYFLFTATSGDTTDFYSLIEADKL